MILLDAYAVLALLKDERAAESVQQLLDGGETARLTALGISEVLDHLVRLAGADPDDAVLDLAELDLMAPVVVDAAIAASAGLLRARYYHRTDRPLSLADCVAAAAAQQHDARLATSDPPLLAMCRAERIGSIALPGTTGPA